MINKLGIYILFCTLIFFSCFQSEKTKKLYPANVISISQKEKFDFTCWKIYEYLGSERLKKTKLSPRNSSTELADTTLCISLEFDCKFISKNNIDAVSCFIPNKNPDYYCECYGSLHMLPNTFYFEKDSIWIVYGDTGMIDYESFRKFINWDEKEKEFPAIIRKYKDQLNPWLKIEAQRRGIID